MKWVSLLGNMLGGIILGLFIATVWFGNDERCSVLLHNSLQKTFKEQFGAQFNGRVTAYSFFPATIELADVSVCALSPEKDSWWWKARTMRLHFSLLSSLYTRLIDMHAYTQGVTSYSPVEEGVPTIMHHIQAMVASAQGGLPISLQTLSLLDTQAVIEDTQAGIKTQLLFDSQLKRSHEGTTVRCSISSGDVSLADTVLVHAVQAKITALLSTKKEWSIYLESSVRIPLLDTEDQEVVVRGVWQNNHGDITCANTKKTVFFSPVRISKKEGVWSIEAQGTVPLYGLSRLFGKSPKHHVEGALHGAFVGSLHKGKGVVTLDALRVYGVQLPTATGTFEYKDKDVQGTLLITHAAQQCQGSWSLTNNGTQAVCTLTNSTPLLQGILKYWQTKPGNLQVTARWHKDTGTVVDYLLALHHQKLATVVQTSGKMTLSKDRGSLVGTLSDTACQDTEYQLDFSTDPLHVVSLTYHDAQEKKVGSCTYNPDTQDVTASVSYQTVQHLMHLITGFTVPGSGMLTYQGHWNYPVLAGSLQYTQGVVRVSGWYNVIAACAGAIDIDVKKWLVTGKEWGLTLHKGSVASKSWRVHLDPWQGVTWVHIPLHLQECFVNWKKDMYAVVSGSFVVQKQSTDIPMLRGFLCLDRSQLRANILSFSPLQSVATPVVTQPLPLGLDLHVFTQQPVEVVAAPLQTKAAVNLVCRGTVTDPLLQGAITLSEGVVHLPAHPLTLVKGALLFCPEHTYDPEVELVAQQRIKKYLITLSVGGTVQDPHIMLDSSPPLSEQQILMLLLGGSEEESLKSMMPALLMRNIEGILFGSQRTGTSYLPAWLEPLRKVTFVPHFTDQSGRGGFKGAIEIEVSKRLRAVIEKNFSLTEDTVVKVDYLLSDEVSLRGVRDARGDLGASIEMRLKFSRFGF